MVIIIIIIIIIITKCYDEIEYCWDLSIAGTLMCLSTMIRLELPHVNLLTKVDLLESPSEKKRRKRRNVKLEQLHISQRNKNRDRDNNNNNDNEEDNDENEEEEEASDDEKDYDSSEEVDKKLSKFLDNDVNSLVSELNEEMNPKFHKLNLAMASLIEDYSMVGFLPFNMKVLYSQHCQPVYLNMLIVNHPLI